MFSAIPGGFLLLRSANLAKFVFCCSKSLSVMGKLAQKVRTLWNGPHRSFFRYATCLTAGVIIYAGFFSDDSILRWVKAGVELRRQRVQIERYRQEIKDMDKQVQMLSTDRDTLEEFARETFHFAAPGDDVYILGK